jgi:hypothetical protein
MIIPSEFNLSTLGGVHLEVTGCISSRPQPESGPKNRMPNWAPCRGIANAKSIADANGDIKG